MSFRKIFPRLPALLTYDEITEMHEAALRLIEEVGVEVENKKALRHLLGSKGVIIKDSRVYIKSWLVEEYVEEQRKRGRHLWSLSSNESNDEVIIKYVSGVNRFILDPRTDNIRPVTTEDLLHYTKLVDSLYSWGVRGAAPGVPQDVPPRLQALKAFWIGSKYSRCGGGTGATSRPLVAEEYLYRMHKIMEMPFSLPVYVVSPLKLKGQALNIALHFFDREGVSFSVGSMPTMGATAPLSFIAAFVLAIGEILGAYTIMKLIVGERKVSSSINAHPFDMKYGGLVFGSPEHNLCDLIQIQINRYYGQKTISTRSIRSMAFRPGIEAAAEKAASAIMGALAGSKRFSTAGLLALDNVFSPEQLIVDCEIVDYASRFVKGLTFEDLDMWLEIIKDGVRRGNFIAQKETLRNFRKFYWLPRLFEYRKFSGDISQSEEITKKKIHDIIEEKIGEHDFKLEEEKERDLDKVYKEACKVLI